MIPCDNALILVPAIWLTRPVETQGGGGAAAPQIFA